MDHGCGIASIYRIKIYSMMVVSGNAENCGTSVDRENGHILYEGKSFPE